MDCQAPEYALACEAYHRYAAVTDYKNFQGNPMPAFAALPEKIQEAWDAAVAPTHLPLGSFGWALAQLNEGHKVARAIWGGYWQKNEGVSEQNESPVSFTVVLAFLKNGGVAPAQPYWEDMLATDWKILD